MKRDEKPDPGELKGVDNPFLEAPSDKYPGTDGDDRVHAREYDEDDES